MTLLRPYRHMRLSRSGMGGISRFDLVNVGRRGGSFWAGIRHLLGKKRPGRAGPLNSIFFRCLEVDSQANFEVVLTNEVSRNFLSAKIMGPFIAPNQTDVIGDVDGGTEPNLAGYRCSIE